MIDFKTSKYLMRKQRAKLWKDYQLRPLKRSGWAMFCVFRSEDTGRHLTNTSASVPTIMPTQ